MLAKKKGSKLTRELKLHVSETELVGTVQKIYYADKMSKRKLKENAFI